MHLSFWQFQQQGDDGTRTRVTVVWEEHCAEVKIQLLTLSHLEVLGLSGVARIWCEGA